VSLELTDLRQQEEDRIRRRPEMLFDLGRVAAHLRPFASALDPRQTLLD
jgi:hypothetical protein